MTAKITFELDGKTVEAEPGETIWQVAKRKGTTIPHLCWNPEPGYRADGNCRACMVEIEGERVLAASCQRKAAAGMKVKTGSERAKKSREMVFELLLADQPKKRDEHDPKSKFWNWVDAMGVQPTSRLPRVEHQRCRPDYSHSAIAVNLDACINCGLCVRACREVQTNDVIGMAYRGHDSQVVFDFDKQMGPSTCVACGECVQVCPTGALMEKNLLDTKPASASTTRTGGRHALPLLRRRLPDHGARQGQQDPLRRRPQRAGQREPPVRQGPLRLRLHPSSRSPDEAPDPPRRRRQGRLHADPRRRLAERLPRGNLGGSPRPRRVRSKVHCDKRWRQRAGRASARPRARTRKPICSRSSSGRASARTTSTTARGCATPRPWPR